MQVKIIIAPKNQLEGQINVFLQSLGTQKGYKISLHDIKYQIGQGANTNDQAMVIYNKVQVTKP